MMSKSDMRRDVDSPPAWWEGWPLTAVVIAFSTFHWGGCKGSARGSSRKGQLTQQTLLDSRA